GPLVRSLQRELRRRGARIAVDGRFGPATRRAVQRLQRRMRMRPTGVADAPLMRRLGLQTLQAAASAPRRVPATLPSHLGMALWPAAGRLSSPFGPRWGRMHEGIDITNRSGTPIVAALGGVVSFTGWYGGYGQLVRVDHGGGLETRYAHLSRIDVAPGEPVAPGDPLGRMGTTGSSTGVHLHFEVRLEGRPYDPLTALPPRAAAAAR
ncbi:MAG TPA: peptidoglycan DD-metalloendopeptidase family protein, partial [Miltoncostaeaceae bacterium]|nr:peptidoglycan DD-metalloendopeptidase family protein [Miltoncostaeaceae bacterium]